VHSVEGQGRTFHFCIPIGISIPLNTELVEEKQDVLKATSPTASIRASTNDQNNYYHKSSEAYGSHPCRRRYVDLTEFFNSDCDIIIYFFLKENFRREF